MILFSETDVIVIGHGGGSGDEEDLDKETVSTVSYYYLTLPHFAQEILMS